MRPVRSTSITSHEPTRNIHAHDTDAAHCWCTYVHVPVHYEHFATATHSISKGLSLSPQPPASTLEVTNHLAIPGKS